MYIHICIYTYAYMFMYIIRVCIKRIKKNKMFFAHLLKLYKSFGMTVCKKTQTLKSVPNVNIQKLSRNTHESGNGFKLEIHKFQTTRVLPVAEYQHYNTPENFQLLLRL